jgi:hypothetical protein
MSTLTDMNDFGDGLPMRGILQVVVRDAVTGGIKRKHQLFNQITYNMANLLVELVCQRATDPAPLQDQIYSLRLGSGTTQPTRSDISLQSPIGGYVIGDSGKVTLAPGEVTLIITIPSGDLNSQNISEAGLFSGGTAQSTSDTPGTAPGTTRLLARQIFPTIAKTSAITVDVSWTLLYQATP